MNTLTCTDELLWCQTGMMHATSFYSPVVSGWGVGDLISLETKRLKHVDQ